MEKEIALYFRFGNSLNFSYNGSDMSSFVNMILAAV